MSKCDRVVIFLDIDGVLLPVPRFTFGGGDLSEQSVQFFQKIVEGCGGANKVIIILSSTWRNFPEQVQRLNRFFEKVAGDHVPPVTGGTPNGTPKVTQVTYYADDLSEQRLVRDRVDEIKRWINTHIHDYPEAIGGRWLSIDDMQLDVDERMCGHFLKTETEVGLTEESVTRALDIIKLFPTPEIAAQKAAAAAIDPVLKDEEIEILETRCSGLTKRVEELEEELHQARAEIHQLQIQRREWEREQKEMGRRFEDVSYRLAQYDFAKKNDVLRLALEALTTPTGTGTKTTTTTGGGNDRRELEQHIKTLVNLLRRRRELEKTLRKSRMKAKMEEKKDATAK
ncbi:uncharacterized protein TM35_000431160 [Trypanosoma theileri]|uniref:Uncharacterized protein n=1 Tax=Trypanosoma theileri TaxID=67003 RepID=A0A1X0NJ52_9TRYP|nr:uncharacterized protein TM35_000431160 [Trypanosoma theileri]ORC84548.1 hypothetical protein TM35_000431160 [Trypanosoma theileri]